MRKAERETKMKKKSASRKVIYRQRRITALAIIASTVLLTGVVVKGNQPKIIGYTYDTGSTVWEMAQKHCPDGMDIRDVVREIEKINGIENATVYDYISYQIPIYENSTRETEYLDMNTIVSYDVSESGILLHTSDGNGYYIEK